jgi:DNA-binding response OmpR family regulator
MSIISVNPAIKNDFVFNVVIVEDDLHLRREISGHLIGNGFIVHDVPRASSLDELVSPDPIDLYVIDLNLPGESGLSLSKRIRSKYPLVGIVIITARLGLNDKLASYSHGGADFYLNKPFSPEELVLILQNLGRRVKKVDTSNAWSLSLRDRIMLSPDGKHKLRLTGREKSLLVALSQAKDNILESGYISDLFTNPDVEDFISKHALEELIARLRRKLRSAQDEGAEPAIKSVWGVGYQLCIHINIEH